MPIDGQAEMAPSAEDDLVSFLVDNDDADIPQDAPTTDDEPGDEPENSDVDNPETDPAEGDPEDEDPDADEPEEKAKPTSGLKFKVPVKGDDGAESTIEVDEKELIAGYQRHSDYTRKTQDLARQRDEVQTSAQQEVEQTRTAFLTQAQIMQQAVRHIAGLMSPQEMAALAQTDPAAWVAQNAREQQVNGILQQMAHAAQQTEQQGKQQQAQQTQAQFQKAWGVLGQQGIDKVKLQGIFEGTHKRYGVPMERFAQLYDPALVLIMRDANAYKDLVDKKAAVTKKVAAAPRLPPQRQSVPAAEKVNQRLEKKFRSGTAGLRDLANFV
jgi:hypothetical protein